MTLDDFGIKRIKLQAGRDCHFYPINKDWGLKLFDYPDDRDDNYQWQEKCRDIGIAPDIGEKVTVEIDGDEMYGFLTGIAEIAVDVDSCKYPPCTYDAYDDGERNDMLDRFQQEFDFLPFDIHNKNWGFYKGKAVIIDFSRIDIENADSLYGNYHSSTEHFDESILQECQEIYEAV